MRSVLRSQHVALGLLIVHGFFVVRSALAQAAANDVSIEQAQRMLDSFIAVRQKPIDLNLKRLEWRRYFTPRMSVAEIEAMRERVRTTPGSLERDTLESEEKRFRGESWLDCSLVSQADSYRLSSDFAPGSAGSLTYDDSVATPGFAWGLGPYGLRVEGATSSKPRGASVRSVGPPMIAELRRVLAANTEILLRSNAALAISSATDAGWNASSRGVLNGREWEFQASGIWSPDRSGVRLSELRCNVVGDRSVGIRWLFAEWKYNSEIGFEIPTDVREFDGVGKPVSRVSFLRSGAIDPKEFASLIAIPSVGATDPIRGAIGDRVVEDSRSGESTYTTYKDGIAAATVVQSDLPAERSRRRLITIGWIVGGSLCVGFVALAIVRRGGVRHVLK